MNDRAEMDSGVWVVILVLAYFGIMTGTVIHIFALVGIVWVAMRMMVYFSASDVRHPVQLTCPKHEPYYHMVSPLTNEVIKLCPRCAEEEGRKGMEEKEEKGPRSTENKAEPVGMGKRTQRHWFEVDED